MKYRFALAALALAGCSTGPASLLPPPAAIADRTVLDEQAAITVTLAYTAAAKAAALAISTGLVRDRDRVAQIGQADRAAFAAVKAAEVAYAAGNAQSYGAAIVQVNAGVSALLATLD